MDIILCAENVKKSIIDIGTNTMLLLIAERIEKIGSVKTLLDMQRVPRLGKGVDVRRNILPESVTRAIEILNEYKELSTSHGSAGITATATSFIRDSNNGKEFVTQVKEATGIDIEILSGEDEARYTFLGGVFDKATEAGDGNITVIDIGGGSTEITLGRFDEKSAKAEIIHGKSLDVGSVRLNEKFLSNHPPDFESIVNAELYIKNLFKQSFQADKSDESDKSDQSHILIGVAGTVTTLAAIKHKLPAFDASVVDGTILTLDEIERIFSELASMPLEEIYALGNYMEGRADIILPGILILKSFMAKFGFEEITVSTKGLRYGIFLRETN